MTILLGSPPFAPAPARAAPPVRLSPAVGAEAVRTDLLIERHCVAIILPVTTVRQAIRVAFDRTRRMTLLGTVPGVRLLAVPWLFPLHLLIVGLTADHIRLTPDASLSYSDGTTPRVHVGSLTLALVLAAGWLAALWGVIDALTWFDLAPARVLVALALLAPAVEFVGLLEFAVCNPEWLTLKRARKGRPDRRTVFILTSLVSNRDGCGAAGRLMDLTYPQWQAADAVVVGYPASRALVSYYIRMGAQRFCAGTPDQRPAGRCVTFDCRRPLRAR